MKSFGRVLGWLLLAVVMPPAAAQGQAKAGEQPAVAYAVDGVLYLATESGRVVQTVKTELPIGNFAISPNLGTVVPRLIPARAGPFSS
jgi:hypothetical protein